MDGGVNEWWKPFEVRVWSESYYVVTEERKREREREKEKREEREMRVGPVSSVHLCARTGVSRLEMFILQMEMKE